MRTFALHCFPCFWINEQREATHSNVQRYNVRLSLQRKFRLVGLNEWFLRGIPLGYIFEWDAKKAKSNARKHGVTFDEATTVFADPLSLLMPDPDHSFDEERYVVLGMSTLHELLIVAFAERPPRTRLISARRAMPAERKLYEEG